MVNITLIYTTLPTQGEADLLSQQLIERGYAACVNMVPITASVYVDKNGAMQRHPEVGMLIKTSRNRVDEVMLEVHRLHPYTEPAILVWETTAHPAYAAFVEEQTKEF